MIAEKTSETVIKIKAKEEFGIVTTMNPSGDYGKKELSPALRNRMSEIWVESYFEQPSLKKYAFKLETEISQIDVFRIIYAKLQDQALS